MTNNVLDALNNQVNSELSSAYFYLGMAVYFDGINLPGCAHWMRLQSHEELEHVAKIYQYIYSRRWQVKLFGIEEPPSKWQSPLKAFEEAFKHEQLITTKYNILMDLAVANKDYPTISFLQWFIEEQVEEESSVDAIIRKIKMINEDQGLMLIIDAELATRGSKK